MARQLVHSHKQAIYSFHFTINLAYCIDLCLLLGHFVSVIAFRQWMVTWMIPSSAGEAATIAVSCVVVTFLSLVAVVPLISYCFCTPRFDYDGKHVIITGGSSGIGLECAKLYAKHGANVTIVARDASKLAAAREAIAAHQQPNRKVLIASVDTGSSEEAVVKALAPCLKELGDADVLVNCAGTSVSGDFNATSSSEFERMLRVNLLGSVYPTKAVVGGMKTKCGAQGGRIVFVASQVAQAAIHGYTAYAASKWALRGLAEALQMELRPFGIRVSVCYPPDTDTPGYKEGKGVIVCVDCSSVAHPLSLILLLPHIVLIIYHIAPSVRPEMLTKPDITKRLSDSGSVFSPATVARDILRYSARGYFGISTGLDGWLLKQLHPGMGPVNDWWEVTQGILFAPLCRVISLFYVVGWDMECKKAAAAAASSVSRAAGNGQHDGAKGSSTSNGASSTSSPKASRTTRGKKVL